MSGNASTWARAQTVGDGEMKALLKEYAHWASEDYSSWVSNPTLVASLEKDIKTIRKARERLVELGYLIETKRRAGGTGNIVVYQMIAPTGSVVVQSIDRRTQETVSLSPPSLEEYEAKQDQKRSPSKSGTPKGNQKRSPSKNGAPPDVDSRGTKSGLQGVPDFPEGAPHVDPDLNDLGLERSECGVAAVETEENRSTQKVEDESLKTAPTGFDAWWAVWPAASGRKQDADICRSHWTANGLDVHAKLIIAHTEAMKRTVHWKTGGDPTPIKYLERKRWTDCSADDIEAQTAAATPDDGSPWYESVIPEVIEAKGAALSVRPRFPDEAIASYRVLVVNASKEKSAVDFVLRDAKKFNDQRLFDFAVRTFGDALLPTDFYA